MIDDQLLIIMQRIDKGKLNLKYLKYFRRKKGSWKENLKQREKLHLVKN